MDRIEFTKKPKRSSNNIIFRAVGILLIITMLSIWLVSGIFAKYVIVGSYEDAAHVAGDGSNLVLLEHQANLKNGEYQLDTTEEVTENTYDKVIPGVDIAKDPFIRLNIDSDITYKLYIRVVESKPFPATVTYELTEDWELVDRANGIYKYKEDVTKSTIETIKVLKNDKLYVSEHYVGNSQEFTLSFNAWLVQKVIN